MASVDALEQVGPPVAEHGEGPVWDDAAGVLLMVDIHAGELLTLDVGGDRPPRRERVGESVGVVRPRSGGGVVAGVGTGFALVAPDRSVRTLEPLWPAAAGLRMNDGACDPTGRFWAGSMLRDEANGAGRGGLFRLDPGGAVERVLTDLTIPNGLVFDADGRRALFIDSPTRRVDVLHLDDGGGVTGREPLADVRVGDGVPDGMCRDADGGIWVAVHGGGAVVHLSADGEVLDVLALPTSKPTACTFGGPDLDVLYVTTSALAAPAAERSSAGALFAVRPGVRGVPAHRFAG